MAKLIFERDRWPLIYTFTCDGHQHLASLHPEHDFRGQVRARNPLLFIIHDLDGVDQPGAAHVAHACEPAQTMNEIKPSRHRMEILLPIPFLNI